jgi:hypothetical protein
LFALHYGFYPLFLTPRAIPAPAFVKGQAAPGAGPAEDFLRQLVLLGLHPYFKLPNSLIHPIICSAFESFLFAAGNPEVRVPLKKASKWLTHHLPFLYFNERETRAPPGEGLEETPKINA